METINDLVNILSEQLELYSKCDWNKSAVEKRKEDEKNRTKRSDPVDMRPYIELIQILINIKKKNILIRFEKCLC